MKLKQRCKLIFWAILFIIGAREVYSQAQQVIDLGAMSVEGKLITPGDLSIDSDEEASALELFKRKQYKDHLNINLQSIF